jgi:hypothetical protein
LIATRARTVGSTGRQPRPGRRLTPHPVPIVYQAAIDLVVRFVRKEIPNKMSALVLIPRAGKVQTVDPDSSAVQTRDKSWWVIIEARFDPKKGASGRDAARAWTKAVVTAFEELGASQSSHAIEYERDAEAGTAAAVSWGDKVARLQEIKAKYDPKNTLTLNRNIVPNLQG